MQTPVRPVALFRAAFVVLFMILKWCFNWIVFLNFSSYWFHNHLPQAVALDQRFAALGVHEKRPVTFFNYLGTIYHEANINFHAICKCHAIECYAIAQINLFMVYKYFFAIDMRGLQRLCCVKLSEQFVKTWQAVDRANWALLILNWFAIH